MARTIKVHSLSRRGMEMEEVELHEAEKILEEANTWGWIVADARTQEVIWEIGPNVKKIMIISMLGRG